VDKGPGVSITAALGGGKVGALPLEDMVELIEQEFVKALGPDVRYGAKPPKGAHVSTWRVSLLNTVEGDQAPKSAGDFHNRFARVAAAQLRTAVVEGGAKAVGKLMGGFERHEGRHYLVLLLMGWR
jgi:hypothetical protein